MRLLLDECVPRPLLRDLIGHDARHVVDMGWSSKRNGELLTLMVVAFHSRRITRDRPSSGIRAAAYSDSSSTFQ